MMKTIHIALVLSAFPYLLSPLPGEEEDRISPFITDVRQLTFDGRRSGEGYFSADGTKMVFQSEREEGNPFFQIYLLDLETGDTLRISTGIGKTTCAWIHPSNERVMFASTHEDPNAVDKQKKKLEERAAGTESRYSWDYDEHYELYARDLKTQKLTRLTDARGYDAEGCYSPDGMKIVFASNRHAFMEELSEEQASAFAHDPSVMMDIYIMDADGSNVKRLTDAPGYDGGPFFSADGKKICWRRFSTDGARAEIYTMNADGSDWKLITEMGVMSWAPFFHPSGEYLIFSTNKHGFNNFELYMVDAQGLGEPVPVTSAEGFDGLPTFSPDGKTIAWTSNRTATGKSQIFVAHWDHEAALEVLDLRELQNWFLDDTAITADDLKIIVEELAGEHAEGRRTGTSGELRATEWARNQLLSIELAPAGDQGTFFQGFPFTSGVKLGSGNQLSPVIAQVGTDLVMMTQADRDWRPLAFSKSGEFDFAPVVFAVYGIVAPEGPEGQGEYDSYVHLDVKDKWVMVLRYMPEGIPPERRQHLSRYASLRHKAMIARDKGAKGIILVSGPNAKVKEQLIPLSLDGAVAGTSIAAISITDELATAMLPELQSLHDELDTGEPVMGKPLADHVKLAANIDLVMEKGTGRNVLARLNAGDQPGKTAVVIGAHIDHLGRGKHSGSLSDEKDAIHYGADDNASGVAAVLEAAHQLAAWKREGKLNLKHDIIFALWSGEEMGLIGSQHFVDQLRDEDGRGPKVIANINLDMVGRYTEKLGVHGVGSSSVWPKLIEKANVPIGLPLALVKDSYLPTDSTSFYLSGVPAMSLFTGTHEDYHKPSDTPEKLNYEAMEKIARLATLLTRALATSDTVPDYVKQDAPQQRGARAGLRAYLGTIPDYAQDENVKGVKLSGVGKNGPAEKAGVRGGDVVVQLAGRKIENIYDYTYAIEALKVGQETTLVVLRNGERIEMKITPGSRE